MQYSRGIPRAEHEGDFIGMMEMVVTAAPMSERAWESVSARMAMCLSTGDCWGDSNRLPRDNNVVPAKAAFIRRQPGFGCALIHASDA
ncbi:hypothetical protein N9248_00130 [bacterium]|nr:hypothetical protein [bacterium]